MFEVQLIRCNRNVFMFYFILYLFTYEDIIVSNYTTLVNSHYQLKIKTIVHIWNESASYKTVTHFGNIL